MGINPSTPQGMLNRLRGSVIISSNPALNVTSDYLTSEGIQIAPQGNVTDLIDTMTGVVGSPLAKQKVSVTINLNRAQDLVNEWRKQIRKNTFLGSVRIVSDTAAQDDRKINNCFVLTLPQETMNGSKPEWSIVISGYEIVNSDLWSLS